MQPYSSLLRALVAPFLPKADANGGLGWSDLYENPRATVQVQIILPLGNDFLLNDTVDLYWQKRLVASVNVNDTILATRVINFNVASTAIIPFPDGIHEVYYTVTTAIGGQVAESPVHTVRVKTNIPGGRDPEAGTPYINENLVAPQGIPDNIPENSPGLTITVPAYLDMTEGDEVTLAWGAQLLEHPPLSPSEVGKPVMFAVTAAMLAASPGSVVVRYGIWDVVNNWSLWSREKTTFVGDDGSLPDVVEDFGSQPRNLISAGGSITTQHMTIRFVAGDGEAGFDPDHQLPGDSVNVANPVLNVAHTGYGNQQLELDLRQNYKAVICDVYGVLANSATVSWLDAYKTVLSTKVLPEQLNQQAQYTSTGAPIRYMTISNRNEDWTLWDNFVMTPSTTRSPDSMNDRSRKTTMPTNAQPGTGTPQQSGYPAPTVTQAPGGVLDPSDANPGGITVVVTYPSMTGSDFVRLRFNNDRTLVVEGSDTKTVTFTVPMTMIAPTIGKTVQVNYTVTNAATEPAESAILNLRVEELSSTDLPTPQIVQAAGNDLDVTALSADADVQVAPWPFIATGQQMTLTLDGTADLVLPAWNRFPITHTGAQSAKVPLTYLKS